MSCRGPGAAPHFQVERLGLGFRLAVQVRACEPGGELVGLLLRFHPIAVTQRPGEPSAVLAPLHLEEAGFRIRKDPDPVPAPLATLRRKSTPSPATPDPPKDRAQVCLRKRVSPRDRRRKDGKTGLSGPCGRPDVRCHRPGSVPTPPIRDKMARFPGKTALQSAAEAVQSPSPYLYPSKKTGPRPSRQHTAKGPITRRRPPPTPKLQPRNPTPAPLWTSALLQGDRNPPESVIGSSERVIAESAIGVLIFLRRALPIHLQRHTAPEPRSAPLYLVIAVVQVVQDRLVP